VLNAKQDFTRTALGTVLYNIGLNLGLLPGFFMTFHTRASSPSEAAVYAATWGVVLGAMLQVGVQVPGLYKVKMRYSFAFDWQHPGVQQIGRQMVPRVINAIMLSFSTVVDRYLLSFLGGGLINAYLQAFSILLMPVSLFGSSVSTAAFPSLANYAAQRRFERVRSVIMENLRGILFLTIPSGVGMAVLAFPITQARLEHGNFDLPATQFASVALFFFALGLPALAAVEILTRSFYALRDSVTPVIVSIGQFIFKIGLSLVLINLAVLGSTPAMKGAVGMGMLAFSTSCAGLIEAAVLFWLLHQRIGQMQVRATAIFLGRVLLASVAMGIALLVLRLILDATLVTTAPNQLLGVGGTLLAFIKLLIEIVVGAITYFLAARLLGIGIDTLNLGPVRRLLDRLKLSWI